MKYKRITVKEDTYARLKEMQRILTMHYMRRIDNSEVIDILIKCAIKHCIKDGEWRC